MFDMFKSWAYWKPIVILLGSITVIVSFFHFATALMIELVMAALLIGIVLFLLHMLGMSFYQSYMDKIKSNYRKLTDKNWDDQ